MHAITILRRDGQSIQDTAEAHPLLPWCIWHHKSWLETGLLSSNTKKLLYHHVLPWISISQDFPKVRSPNGLQIHNSAWRFLGCIGGGWDLQIPPAPKNLKNPWIFVCFFDLRSIFRFFDEDRDGFLSHEARLTFSNRHSKDGDLWVVDRDFTYRRSIAWNRSYQSFGVPLRRKKMVVTWPWRCSRALVRRPSKENQFFFFKTLMHLHLKLRKCKWWKKIVT